MSLQNEIDKLKTLQESFNELSSKVLDTQAVLTELNHGKQEMVDAIKSKGGDSNADKSLSEIAGDVRAISNVDKTFNNLEYFMVKYGLSMSPLQLISKHYDTKYTSYICYIVDADKKINLSRSAYMMYTANGAVEDPEGEYTIPEWENRFGYFILAYKSSSITWENYEAYFIGMYGADTSLDNRVLTNFRGIECDACKINILNNAFNSRAVEFLDFRDSEVAITGTDVFTVSTTNIETLTMPQLKSLTSGAILNNSRITIITLDGLEELANRALRNSGLKKVSLRGLKTLHTNAFTHMFGLKEIVLPSLITANGTTSFASLDIERIIAPNATEMNGYAIFQSCNSLIDIECGELYRSTNWDQWIPTSVLSDQDKVVILDKNIREHIAAKIKDLSGTSAQTFTFSQGIRNIMTEETEQAFTAKNWNIAPAKSV